MRQANLAIARRRARPTAPAIEPAHDDERCVSCGACVAQCGAAALVIDGDYQVSFSAASCRGCGLCIPACAYGALSSAIATEEPQS